jgi:hypothetical protein
LANPHEAVLGPVAAGRITGRLVDADLGASSPTALTAVLGTPVSIIAIAIDDAAIRQWVVDARVVEAGVLGAEVAVVAVGIAIAACRELGVIADVVRPAAVGGAEVFIVAVRGVHATARDGLEGARTVHPTDVAGTGVAIVAILVEDAAAGERLLEATERGVTEGLGAFEVILRAEDGDVRTADLASRGDDTSVRRAHALVIA